LGSSIYDNRLRYAISELLDIPSRHITGFTLNNITKSIEPYWPSITINGQAIKLNEEHYVNQSISNNASQIANQSLKINRIKKKETVITYKYYILSFFVNN
jgi:malate/lactate dehydrogenase